MGRPGVPGFPLCHGGGVPVQHRQAARARHVTPASGWADCVALGSAHLFCYPSAALLSLCHQWRRAANLATLAHGVGVLCRHVRHVHASARAVARMAATHHPAGGSVAGTGGDAHDALSRRHWLRSASQQHHHPHHGQCGPVGRAALSADHRPRARALAHIVGTGGIVPVVDRRR